MKDPNRFWDRLTSWPQVKLKDLPQLAKERMRRHASAALR